MNAFVNKQNVMLGVFFFTDGITDPFVFKYTNERAVTVKNK